MSEPEQKMPVLHMKEKDLSSHRFKGLVEHSHHPLTCSACGRGLLDVMVTEPNYPETFRYRADCPYCGDHSFPSDPIQGGVYIGPIGDVFNTSFDTDGDIIYLRTEKR
jgi:hypothetical protein